MIVDMGKRSVNHSICRECVHDDDCSQVCIAVEMWVQFSFETSIQRKLEMLDNVASKLDLKNSIKA